MSYLVISGEGVLDGCKVNIIVIGKVKNNAEKYRNRINGTNAEMIV